MNIRSMIIPRLIINPLRHHLQRGKSILLLGPRQTGKSTLVTQDLKPDMSYSFAQAQVRQRYEKNSVLFEKELIERIKAFEKSPIIFIDEVQKIPVIMDIAQHLIDSKLAQFILTGSSARKLRRGKEINLLPGRVAALKMAPLMYKEIPSPKPPLEDILLYGTLPAHILETNKENIEVDLYSYVTTYLEDEIRAEAAVRNLGSFSRFLELAASEAGRQLNFTRLAQDIGISDTTIASYYQILEDCLIIHRIDPITQSRTKRRLIKSPKYLFFDLGIRRACANEGRKLPPRILGELFEHFVGNELIYQGELISPSIKIKYWRDSAGPEVDYIIDFAHRYIPIEVKWTDQPSIADTQYLQKFINEYADVDKAFVVCRTPHRYMITDKIMALPWQEINAVFE